jgi:uncharacterized membrane protein
MTDAALPASPPRVRPITVHHPWWWLRRGWHDLTRCPLPGLAHGVATVAFGAILVAIARDRFWLLAGAFSGFLLVAPIVATGLYAVSRELGVGGRPSLRTVLAVWRSHDTRLVSFGFLLAFAGTGWVLTSASLINAFAGHPIDKPADFIRHVVLSPDSWLFEAWLVMGGAMAAPMFASTVVAVPLLLDRPIGVLDAVLASWRAVLENPAPLALWAGVLMALTAIGMATLLMGLLVIVPWLAHASWHAYRDLIEPDIDPRPAPGA